MLNAVLACLGLSPSSADDEFSQSAHKKTDAEVAKDVIQILRTTEKGGKGLKSKLDDAVSTTGWTESLAQAILAALATEVQSLSSASEVFKDAVAQAKTEAFDFVKDHPIFFTIIALGVLVLLMPWVISALGFGELGPIEGELPTNFRVQRRC